MSLKVDSLLLPHDLIIMCMLCVHEENRLHLVAKFILANVHNSTHTQHNTGVAS